MWPYYYYYWFNKIYSHDVASDLKSYFSFFGPQHIQCEWKFQQCLINPFSVKHFCYMSSQSATQSSILYICILITRLWNHLFSLLTFLVVTWRFTVWIKDRKCFEHLRLVRWRTATETRLHPCCSEEWSLSQNKGRSEIPWNICESGRIIRATGKQCQLPPSALKWKQEISKENNPLGNIMQWIKLSICDSDYCSFCGIYADKKY